MTIINIEWVRETKKGPPSNSAYEARKGNKPFNTFKEVSINRVAEAISKRFQVQCDAKHVENHLRTVKNQWQIICTIRGESGFEWDDNMKMITCDRATYDAAVMSHKKYEPFLNKSIDHYDEITLVVGKDMATWSFARTFADIDLDDGNQDSVPIDCDNEETEEVRTKVSSSGTSKRKRKNVQESVVHEQIKFVGKQLGKIANTLEQFTADKTPHLYEEVMSMEEEEFDDDFLCSVFDYLVNHECEPKAFLVKTHSMEEVDVLCDRLGIFVDGALQCIGNAKEGRYRESYIFIITTSSSNEEEVENMVQYLSLNANKIYRISGTQKFEMPKQEVGIADVFQAVENAKRRFTVFAWGLADTTLEDVFIKVARGVQEVLMEKTSSVLWNMLETLYVTKSLVELCAWETIHLVRIHDGMIRIFSDVRIHDGMIRIFSDVRLERMQNQHRVEDIKVSREAIILFKGKRTGSLYILEGSTVTGEIGHPSSVTESKSTRLKRRQLVHERKKLYKSNVRSLPVSKHIFDSIDSLHSSR
ncbi:hypothetical protein GOBAR_DD10014 [Gossypium barbadense]|nr:hypothetical protein GOBAR_DD10014 [Gossypium barbadense]